MKNLYPKGKGKIHPSPSHPVGAGGGARGDALSVLNLLPEAILALAALLGAEDREVLAYLVTRSLKGPWSVVAEETRRCRRVQQHQGAAAAAVSRGPPQLHRPMFDCGCFDCYTSFWFRWDSSPDRELIHQAIETFEEHLARSERQSPTAGKGGRRRDRRLGDRAAEKKARKEEEEEEEENMNRGKGKQAEKVRGSSGGGGGGGGGGGMEEVEVVGRRSSSSEEEGAEVEVHEAAEQGGGGGGEQEEVSGTAMEMVAVNQQEEDAPGLSGGERRRGWPDVMGLFNSRLWSLWVPDL